MLGNDEWRQLINEDVPDPQDLKSTREWEVLPGTNASFFNMLPTGIKGYGDGFLWYEKGTSASVMELTQVNTSAVYIVAPGELQDRHIQYNETKGFSFKSTSIVTWGAIRCVAKGVPRPPTSND